MTEGRRQALSTPAHPPNAVKAQRIRRPDVTRDDTPLSGQVAEHVAVAESVLAMTPDLARVAEAVCERLERGGIVYAFGNGGSAADAQHLVGELIGRYRRERRPLAAVALSTDPTVMTCIGNDFAFADVFA